MTDSSLVGNNLAPPGLPGHSPVPGGPLQGPVPRPFPNGATQTATDLIDSEMSPSASDSLFGDDEDPAQHNSPQGRTQTSPQGPTSTPTQIPISEHEAQMLEAQDTVKKLADYIGNAFREPLWEAALADENIMVRLVMPMHSNLLSLFTTWNKFCPAGFRIGIP